MQKYAKTSGNSKLPAQAGAQAGNQRVITWISRPGNKHGLHGMVEQNCGLCSVGNEEPLESFKCRNGNVQGLHFQNMNYSTELGEAG